MSVTKHHSLNDYIEDLEGIEEVSFKIVYMSVALNLTSKKEAYNYLKQIYEEVKFEERVLVNHMDVSNVEKKLGDQGRRNYRQKIKLQEAEIENYEDLELTHPYMYELKEASNDLGKIRKKLNHKSNEFIQDLEEKLADLRKEYSSINGSFCLKGLDGHLKPHKIELDVKESGSSLLRDLEEQEREELSYLAKMWRVQRELVEKLVSVIQEIDSNENELEDIIETAAEMESMSRI